MAEKDKGSDDLNLEMPSLSLRRKRKSKGTGTDVGPGTEPEPAPEVEPVLESGDEPTAVLPATDDPTDALPHATDTDSGTGTDSGTDTDDRFAPPPYVAPETQGAADTAIRPPAPPAPPAPARAARRVTKDLREPKPAKEPKPPREPRDLTLPTMPAMAASVLVGVLVGVFACGATYLAMLGCQEVRGTSACGGPGFFILLAIFVGLVLLGGLLLRVLHVPEPGSTSFLAVGLIAVVALAFLIDVIFEWWMIIVIPVVGALAFAGSHWVTRTFTEQDHDREPG